MEDKKDKKILMAVVVVLILVIVILCIVLIPKDKHDTKLPDWGEKYYDYLKDFKKKSKNTLEKNNVELAEVYNANLYYVSEEVPVLALESNIPTIEQEGTEVKNYLMLIMIIDGEAKEYFVDKENAKVELLYNVEEKEYYYYLIYPEGENTHFVKLADYMKYLIDNSKTYDEVVVKTDEKITVNGEEISKIDTMFIEPKKADIQFDFKPEKVENLKEDLSYYITDVKKVKKDLTDSNKNGVAEELKLVEQVIIELEKEQTEPTPDPEPIDDDPGNCKGTNPNASSNPCICEEFTGCPDGFERICGIGMCQAQTSEEACLQISGAEYNDGYCMAPYL